jgi:hypothetical protein
MHILSELQTLINFGIFVILWLVQIIIYPSFLRMEGEHLLEWHQTYVYRFTWIIAPMILLQLMASVAAVLVTGTVLNWLLLGLVLLCCLLSFGVSVPLHRKIDQGDPTQVLRRQLILTNWPRTILWTAIFVLGCFSSSF